MDWKQKAAALLQSRKFWVLITALVASTAGYATNQIDPWQFIMAVVASLAAYSTGVAIEDAGSKAGGYKPPTDDETKQ